ncbi:MAG: gamma-glutamyltransferase, partial [Nitrospirae bacterium]|nr:gamma-glutamyltransferase [Fimbriimonadaceae bacterium]
MANRKTMTAWLALALLAPSPTQTVSQQKFKQAVVVSDSQIASEVGAAILKQGGSAVDAAIATHFALAVTFPTAGNLGGGGFMVVRMADGQTSAIDYRETAPAAATRDMYLGPDGQADPALSLEGWKAVAVPGSVAGMAEAHRMYGTLPWKALVEPAFALADKGFVVSDSLANQLRAKMSLFRRFPGAYEAFNRSGKPYEWGETLVQPSLAKVLRRIADQGPREFYEGETAQRLASEMKRNGGLITVEDLASYRAVVRKPIEFDYRGHRVLTMPPPSSGGVAVGQMLRMLEPFDLREMGFHSAQRTHLL